MAMQMFQTYLDKSVPYGKYRWTGTAVLLLMFGLRIFMAQGWYIGEGDIKKFLYAGHHPDHAFPQQLRTP